MGEKNFVIWLSDRDYLIVHIRTNKNLVIEYVVKYVAVIDGREHEIARFDSGHEEVHMDILRPDGTKDRVVRFDQLTLTDAVDFAIQLFRSDFDAYRMRYLEWQKTEKRKG